MPFSRNSLNPRSNKAKIRGNREISPSFLFTLLAALALATFSVPSAHAFSTPTISGISPATGTTAGGTPITVTGTGFASGATVTIGGNPATIVSFISATSLTAITPAGSAGAQAVMITNTDTGTVTAPGAFTYLASVLTPTITVVADSSTATVGASISFTATVSGPAMAVTPTGAGSWLVGLITGTPITCPLASGPSGSSNVATYTCTLTATQAGQYGAGFIYGGDSNYAAGPSGPSTLTTVSAALILPPPPPPIPTQLDSITSISASEGDVNTHIIIKGNFSLQQIHNVLVGSKTAVFLATSNEIQFDLPDLPLGKVDISLFDGAAPLLVVPFTYIDTQSKKSPSVAIATSISKAATGSVSYTAARSVIPTPGTILTFTSTVTGSVAGKVPSGTGTWSISGPGNPTCDAPATPLGNGDQTTYSCSITTTSVGTYVPTFTFNGDDNYLATSPISGSGTTVVKPKITTSQISLNLNSTFQIVGSSDAITLSTTVAGSEPTGTLTITLDSASSISPIATYTIDVNPNTATITSDLSSILNSEQAGTYNVKASYGGDSQNSPAVATLDFQVQAQSCITGEVLLSSGYCGAAPGFFGVTKEGVFSVKPCAKGSYSSNPGAKTCTLAPAATYVKTVGAKHPTPCPVGQATRAGVTGATSEQACSTTQVSITSRPSKTVDTGEKIDFLVSTAGAGLITVTESGSLPTGVLFKDQGNGTAKLTGTPSPSAGGVYVLTFTAKNSVNSLTQKITLTVYSKPEFTSENAITSKAAALSGPKIIPLKFIVIASGLPFASISTSSALPDGVSLVDNQDGTATLQGTPAAGSGGQYSIQFVATNSSGSTTQSFTLTVPTVNVYSLSSDGLCVGDGTTTLLYCPVSGIPNLGISFVCNVATCSGPLLSTSFCPGASLSPATITAGMTGQVLNCSISQQTGSNTLTLLLNLTQGGESESGPVISFRSNAAAPILPPIITSLDSSTCIGRVRSGTATLGFTGCPPSGASILINGSNFFYTTTLTPGLCSSLFYVTSLQLLCLLNPLLPGEVANVQAFTPGMGQTSPTGFSVEGVGIPVISELQDAACTGSSVGLALNGCPSVGGSILVIKFSGPVFPSATLTTGLCSNVMLVNSTTVDCTLSSGIAPGSTINVVVKEFDFVSTTIASISF